MGGIIKGTKEYVNPYYDAYISNTNKHTHTKSFYDSNDTTNSPQSRANKDAEHSILCYGDDFLGAPY